MPGSEITCIGPYTLETRLARGGFGTIWKACDHVTGERVAIKILHPELVVSHAIVRRFELEARAIAMLDHPNVVELKEFDKLKDRRPYLIMELLDGPNLESYVREHGSLRPRRVLDILEPLCSALSAAHSLGIIHRDLKASNVVLDRTFDHERVVLLDFGIVKLLEGDGPALTISRVALGSPICMAPEQIQGEPVDARTDIYALGSLMFLMLTGELPFPGRSTDIMHQHLMSPRPRPSDRMDLSPAYDDVILEAMAKKPANRFRCVTELLHAFRHAVELDEASSAAIEIPRMSSEHDEITTLCIGLYVEVFVQQDVLARADEAVLEEVDAIYPRAAGFLESHGFMLAYESGDSALFVRPLPKQEALQHEIRARSIESARELVGLVGGHDEQIRVSLYLHVDHATLSHGLVIDGPLLDITTWVEPCAETGVWLSASMSEGTDT